MIEQFVLRVIIRKHLKKLKTSKFTGNKKSKEVKRAKQ
jgi:hypothetical protein